MFDTLTSKVEGNDVCRTIWRHIEIEIKNSMITQMKSFLLSFIVLIKSLLEKYGQFFVVATKKDQASIVVKEFKKLLDMSESCVKDRFNIYGKASISKIINEVTLSEIAPLSSDANTLDGLTLSPYIQ